MATGRKVDLNQRVSLKKLAEEMGVKERPLIDAACDGRLQAWRVGGKARGELVTTRAALHTYLDAQPAASSPCPVEKPEPATRKKAELLDDFYEKAVATAGRRRRRG